MHRTLRHHRRYSMDSFVDVFVKIKIINSWTYIGKQGGSLFDRGHIFKLINYGILVRCNNVTGCGMRTFIANFSYIVSAFKVLIKFSKLREPCHIKEQHFSFTMRQKLICYSDNSITITSQITRCSHYREAEKSRRTNSHLIGSARDWEESRGPMRQLSIFLPHISYPFYCIFTNI